MPGTIPSSLAPPGLPPTSPEFNNLPTANGTPPIIPHSLNGSLMTHPPYLPQFPFDHHELLHKIPFLPYDFSNIRAMARTGPGLNGSIVPPIPLSEHHSAVRLSSPTSSRPSTTSPPSTTSFQVQINLTNEINSNNENTSDDSDEEQIDVVKSAFVPILRANVHFTPPKMEVPDSTVSDKPPDEPIHKQKCDLKAPSSRKPVHEIAPRSPCDTKLKADTISVQKSVWRPY